MPGRLFATHEPQDFADFGGAEWPENALLPKIEISPGETWPVLVAQANGVGFRNMRWSMIMSGRKNARGRPVMETIVNARSETVFDKSAFAGVQRGVILASGWYEWTGKARSKTRWRLSAIDGAILALAAIWDVWSGPGGIEVGQCATVTCEPNADVRDYHHRMPLRLRQNQIRDWILGDLERVQDLIAVPKAGSIGVEAAPDVQNLIGH